MSDLFGSTTQERQDAHHLVLLVASMIPGHLVHHAGMPAEHQGKIAQAERLLLEVAKELQS